MEDPTTKFVWLAKTSKRMLTTRSNLASDISINRWSTAKTEPDGSKRYRYGFTVRNEAISALGKNVDIAIYRNRVLFKPCKDGEGYKLSASSKSKGSKCPNLYFSIAKNSVTAELEDFIGDYELKYEEFYDLYYIEKKESSVDK